MTWTRPAAGGGRSRTGTPILPPIATSRPACRQHMGDERRGRRFAVGAGDRDKRRVRRPHAALAARKLDIADDSDPRLVARAFTVQCGFGWVSGTPGASTSTAEAAPVGLSEIDEREARGRRRARARRGLSSQAATSAPPATSARAVDRPEPPRPKSATLCPRRVSTGVIVTSASAKRGRPSRARRR